MENKGTIPASLKLDMSSYPDFQISNAPFPIRIPEPVEDPEVPPGTANGSVVGDARGPPGTAATNANTETGSHASFNGLGVDRSFAEAETAIEPANAGAG